MQLILNKKQLQNFRVFAICLYWIPRYVMLFKFFILKGYGDYLFSIYTCEQSFFLSIAHMYIIRICVLFSNHRKYSQYLYVNSAIFCKIMLLGFRQTKCQLQPNYYKFVSSIFYLQKSISIFFPSSILFYKEKEKLIWKKSYISQWLYTTHDNKVKIHTKNHMHIE